MNVIRSGNLEGMTIVCISDTHNQLNSVRVPDGDVLVHAGDLTGNGTKEEVIRELDVFTRLPHKHKVFISGNHDWFFFEDSKAKEIKWGKNVYYLQDSGVTINGLKFYGSPWQPEFCDWAFNLPRGYQLREKWDLIPLDTDVLITHGPAYGHLDKTNSGELTGCYDLASALENRLKCQLHICGHIHEAYGVENHKVGPTFVNASSCTRRYQPTNPPIVIKGL